MSTNLTYSMENSKYYFQVYDMFTCMPYYVVLCYAILSDAMICYAILSYAMLCYAILCYNMLCQVMIRHVKQVRRWYVMSCG